MLPRVDRVTSSALRAEDAAAPAGRPATPELDPALVAEAPHRTAYRGLEVLAVNVEARRGMLFERFVELWGELEDAPASGTGSSGRSSASSATRASAARPPNGRRRPPASSSGPRGPSARPPTAPVVPPEALDEARRIERPARPL